MTEDRRINKSSVVVTGSGRSSSAFTLGGKAASSSCMEDAYIGTKNKDSKADNESNRSLLNSMIDR